MLAETCVRKQIISSQALVCYYDVAMLTVYRKMENMDFRKARQEENEEQNERMVYAQHTKLRCGITCAYVPWTVSALGTQQLVS